MAAAPSGQASEPLPTKTSGPRPLVVYTDGACRGNPGPSSAGWAIYDRAGVLLGTGHLLLGRRTNNEAEYLAAAAGLTAVAALSPDAEVLLRADSELLVRQLLGRYQVRNPRILPLYAELRRIAAGFVRFGVEHVPREQNTVADAEANRALDARR